YRTSWSFAAVPARYERAREPGNASDFQRFQEGHARFRQLHVLLDEIVLHAPDLRGLERLDPVDAPFADRRLHPATATSSTSSSSTGVRSRWRRRRRGVQIDVLHVHRDEAARMLREILVTHESLANRRHLELELDEL